MFSSPWLRSLDLGVRVGVQLCVILCVLPGEEDGVGAEQNQDSGNLASPLGLAADLFGKSGSILNSPPHPAASVSHSYKEGSLPSLVGMVGASVAASEV